MRFSSAVFMAVLTGFVFLSFEILWIRIFSIASKSHPVMFGLVLGVYLFGLGIGAAFIRRYTSVSRDRAVFLLYRLLVVSALLCYLVIPATSFISSLWFYAYRYGLIFVFFASFSFGGIFPLIVRSGVFDEEDAGREVSIIYAANIAGSTLGSFVTGYFFLDYMSIGNISSLSSCICLLLAFLAALSVSSGKKITGLLMPLFIILIIILSNNFFHFGLYEKLMYMPRSKFVPPFETVIENRSGVIAVTKDKTVYGDGAYDGVISTSLSPKKNPEIENAYLAFLFYPDVKDILEIGLSTGSWAQVLVNGPFVKTLTSVEINPGYLDLISRHDDVKSLLQNEKFTAVVDDGRRWLRCNRDRKFDMIIMNTTFYWRNHATDLLSFEFMQMIREHLNPGGILYINTTMSHSAIKTVASAFKYTAQYRVYIIASDSPVIADRDRFRRILTNFEIDGKRVLDLKREQDNKIFNLLTSLQFRGSRCELLRKTEESRIITDDNMVTEFSFIKRMMGKRSF